MPWMSWRVIPPASLVQKRFERLRKKIPLISRQRIYDAAIEIRKRMKKVGKKPTYPIQWDSEKQRKAFFATKGTFIRGYDGPSKIPTKRTGEYVRAWKVIPVLKSPADVGYDVGNPLSHAKYIGGTVRSTRRQSRIHRGRWPLFKEAIDAVVKRLPKSVKRSLQQIARQEGFRTKE